MFPNAFNLFFSRSLIYSFAMLFSPSPITLNKISKIKNLILTLLFKVYPIFPPVSPTEFTKSMFYIILILAHIANKFNIYYLIKKLLITFFHQAKYKLHDHSSYFCSIHLYIIFHLPKDMFLTPPSYYLKTNPYILICH
jgi:hypothetical protein